MKLDWKRAGRASIAESCGFTFAVFPDYSLGEWGWRVITNDDKSNTAVENGSRICTRESAEAACESWLEKHDRPEWHDVTDWLSWAEWRGLKILVRPETACSIGTYYAQATEANGMTRSAPNMTCTTVKSAKDAAEKWIREQGERA